MEHVSPSSRDYGLPPPSSYLVPPAATPDFDGPTSHRHLFMALYVLCSGLFPAAVGVLPAAGVQQRAV